MGLLPARCTHTRCLASVVTGFRAHNARAAALLWGRDDSSLSAKRPTTAHGFAPGTVVAETVRHIAPARRQRRGVHEVTPCIRACRERLSRWQARRRSVRLARRGRNQRVEADRLRCPRKCLQSRLRAMLLAVVADLLAVRSSSFSLKEVGWVA
jgi:hypothetical protein